MFDLEFIEDEMEKNPNKRYTYSELQKLVLDQIKDVCSRKLLDTKFLGINCHCKK